MSVVGTNNMLKVNCHVGVVFLICVVKTQQRGSSESTSRGSSEDATISVESISEQSSEDSRSSGSSEHTSRKDKLYYLGNLYPHARKDGSIVDDYHGMKIKDPYRWLEFTKSPETQKFVVRQNELTLPFLRNNLKFKEGDLIKKQLMKMTAFEEYSAPQRHGNNYFYFHNSGLQNHSVMYIQRNLTGRPEVLFDPNNVTKDGSIALKGYSVSEDGQFIAYCIGKVGSDWSIIFLRNVETGEVHNETLPGVKYPSIAWTHDNKGFFYNKFVNMSVNDEHTEAVSHGGQHILYHTLHTNQSEDILVVEFPNRELIVHVEITECGRYLLVSCTNNSEGAELYYYDLQKLPAGKVTGIIHLENLINSMEYHHEYITNNGTKLILATTQNARHGNLIILDLKNPGKKYWKTLIPEHKTKRLTMAAAIAKNKIITHYVEDVHSILQIHDRYTGKHLSTFSIGHGQITSLSGRQKYNEIFFTFTSFLVPGTIYQYHMPENNNKLSEKVEPSIFRETKIPGYKPSQYETKQVFYHSKDGTRIPMYIVGRVGLLKNEKTPVILYGYGGYGVSLLPSFSIGRLLFLRHFNGMYAIPNIRGGGELGEKWHEAGRRMKKQNSIDDFQAAAEYMIKEKYTKPKYITLMGSSHGALVVAACINQRPDLYGAAIMVVPALDMLRFEKFANPYYSECEFGSPKNKTEFYKILSYSPLHNIKPPANNTQYPATLVLTGDHDDKVPPFHSYKYIATLQDKIGSLQYQINPLLLRVEHYTGQGTPVMQSIQELTDIFVFLLKTLRLKYYPYR